jgi:hypothetical protein
VYQRSPVPPELDELPPELDELPPELDEPPPPHRPVTTASHPCPQVKDDAHPSAGLWQAIPAPPSGNVQECRSQPTGQQDPPPELDDVPPELDDPAPELEEPTPELEDPTPELEEPTPELEDPTPELEEVPPPDDPDPELVELPPRPDEFPPPELDDDDRPEAASLSPIVTKLPLQPAAFTRATPATAKAGAESEMKVRFMKSSLVAALSGGATC